MELTTDVLAFLVAAAFLSGLIDAMAGGGGLITVPALLLAGVDPVTAVATNKVQGVCSTASATYTFAKAGRIHWRTAAPMAAVAGLASVAGALSVKALSATTLAAIVPLLLLAAAIYFGLSPKMRDHDAEPRMPTILFALTVVPAIAFYDGFFGPGAGSFYVVATVSLLGFGVLRATGQAKLLNIMSNLGSLVLFAWQDVVLWKVGIAMGAASLIGAQIGSRLALRHGARLIRPALIVMCTAVALRMMADPANPLRIFVSGVVN